MDGEWHGQSKSPRAVTDEESAFAEAGHALFALVRLLGRPLAGNGPTSATGRAIELSRIMAVQAVQAARDDDGVTGTEIGVGEVAARLAIDPSTASRLVADTIADGYLSAAPAPGDARRRRLALTDAGRALAADARHFQRETFAAATAGWPDAARHEFASHFIAFAATLTAMRERLEGRGDKAGG